jgi:hypothetical protein
MKWAQIKETNRLDSDFASDRFEKVYDWVFDIA